MANYGVQFNRSGKVTVPPWQSGTGPFSIKVFFETGDLTTTGGLIGRDDTTNFIGIYANGKYAVKVGGSAGSVWKSSATGVLSAFTKYHIEMGRTSGTDCYINIYQEDGVTVVDSVTVNNDDNFYFNIIGDIGSGLTFDGKVYQIELTGGTQDRNYLSSINIGTTWSEIINAQDGTLVGLPTNGTEWVLIPDGTFPISLSGPIPNLNVNDGDVVNEDYSGYFTGTETPFIASSAGADFSVLGLTLNPDFTLTGTAQEGSSTGFVIRGTDNASNTIDSNAFDVTVESVGKTRAEIEAADTTGGFNPPFLLNDFDESDLQTDVFTFTIDQYPSAGTLEVTPFSTFKFSGAPDGIYSFTYTAYKNDVEYGTSTVTLNVGVNLSTLSISITGNIPDGTYTVTLTDPNDSMSNIYSGSTTITNGSIVIPDLSYPASTTITGYVVDNVSTPTQGAVISGITA